MAEQIHNGTLQDRIAALGEHINEHRRELSRLHDEYYAAIRQAKLANRSRFFAENFSYLDPLQSQ